MVGQVPVQVRPGVEAGTGVERGERLVEQQQGRFGGERPGQRHPLGLPAGELARLAVGQVGQSDPGQPRDRGGVGLRPAGTSAARSEGDILRRREVREQQVVLEHHPDRTPFGRYERAGPRIVETHAVEDDVSVGEGLKAGQGPQRGGLAGAVGSEQGHHLARRDGDGELEPEGAAVDHEGGVEHGHGAVSQRSRRTTRMVTETVSRTRLSTMASRRSTSRAR
jgi:hypothetical protein